MIPPDECPLFIAFRAVHPAAALPDRSPSPVEHGPPSTPPFRRPNLAAACTALRAAGRRWFRGAVVQVQGAGGSRLADMAQWVEDRQGVAEGGSETAGGMCGGEVASLRAGCCSTAQGTLPPIPTQPPVPPLRPLLQHFCLTELMTMLAGHPRACMTCQPGRWWPSGSLPGMKDGQCQLCWRR